MVQRFYILLISGLVLSSALHSQSTQLTLRGFSEGFYRQATGKMVAVLDPVNQPSVCDSGIIELIDSATYQTVFCAYTLVNTDGYGSCVIPALFNSRYYYASIKFKNTFHLLTKSAFFLTGQPVSIDLTVPQNTCCNFDTTYGVAKAYSGDLNFDGSIDLQDFSYLNNDLSNMSTGYLLSDLNGDWNVDSFDFVIWDVNNANFRYDSYLSNCNPALIGIEETEKKTVEFYPNPCENYFRIKAERFFSEIKIVMFDELGRICLAERFSGEKDIEINTSYLPAGIYYVSMMSGSMIWNKKVIIIRNGKD